MTVARLPDEMTLRAHLEGARFQIGVAEGRWRLADLTWPYALIAVSAAPHQGAPSEFSFRFELSGYPEIAPTTCIWDVAAGTPLPGSGRPKGPDGQILQLFRDNWLEGRALYAPFDRLAIADHGASWADQWPLSKWTRDRDLTFLLGRIYDELHAVDYVGT